ncbi:MAG: helix-turn-helix domain-containing protein, partial [Rhizorhabdus sp.]
MTQPRAEQEPAKRRADGERSRAKLLAVATSLLVEKGTGVPFVEIAEAAGVGVGTVYRHFPKREDLIVAVYQADLYAVCDSAADLFAAHPADAALRMWMGRDVQHVVTKTGLKDTLQLVKSATGRDPFAHHRQRLHDALDLLLTAAKADGSVRAATHTADLLLAIGGLALATGAASGPGQGDRMLDMLFEAFGVADDACFQERLSDAPVRQISRTGRFWYERGVRQRPSAHVPRRWVNLRRDPPLPEHRRGPPAVRGRALAP